jgi:hypothetical protein
VILFGKRSRYTWMFYSNLFRTFPICPSARTDQEIPRCPVIDSVPL